MSRLAEVHRRWSAPDEPTIPVAEGDLAEAERALSFVFPAPYREAVLADGLPLLTTRLWDDIEESGRDLAHLADFLTPEEMVSLTRDYRDGGMPDGVVTFANNSGGNLFVFRVDAKDDAVWMFDHDVVDLKPVAPSFEDWLNAYCDLPDSGA